MQHSYAKTSIQRYSGQKTFSAYDETDAEMHCVV